jgi:hypothetical protein
MQSYLAYYYELSQQWNNDLRAVTDRRATRSARTPRRRVRGLRRGR